MNVLIDTPIWSLALRRQSRQLNAAERHLVDEWVELVKEGQAYLIGPIRQELLSGVRRPLVFTRLRDHLSAFADVPLMTTDYEQTADFFNQCRTKGITGTPVDLLICARAARLRLAIFTTDNDFERYARYLPIHIHASRFRS